MRSYFAFLPSCDHMGERLNGDLREQGRSVWETTLLSVQGCPFEVTLHNNSNNKKSVITLCGSLCTPLCVGLFVLFSWHGSSEQTHTGEQNLRWKLGFVALSRTLNKKRATARAVFQEILFIILPFFNLWSLRSLCGVRMEIKDC